MRKIFLFIVLLITMSVFSQDQNNGTAARVEYKIINNTGLPNTLYATLFIDNEVSIYFEKYSTKKHISNSTNENVVIRPPKFLFEPYTKFDHKKKQVQLFESINAKIFLVEDNYIMPDWTITNESKVIAEYPCIKATTTFRGKKWIAWFAPQVPLSCGPWKLHGLPGLIMESSDVDGFYTMQVEKIEFVKDAIFEKDFKTLYSSKNNKPITYQKYLQDYNDYLENTRIEIMNEKKDIYMPLTVKSNMDKELVFEWDK